MQITLIAPTHTFPQCALQVLINRTKARWARERLIGRLWPFVRDRTNSYSRLRLRLNIRRARKMFCKVQILLDLHANYFRPSFTLQRSGRNSLRVVRFKWYLNIKKYFAYATDVQTHAQSTVVGSYRLFVRFRIWIAHI